MSADMTALDPVTFAVLTGRLEQIADEMDATLYRSAFNPIIAEARDACHGLYHRETAIRSCRPERAADLCRAMAFAVRAVIEKVKRDGGLEEATSSCSTTPMPAARISMISGWSSR